MKRPPSARKITIKGYFDIIWDNTNDKNFHTTYLKASQESQTDVDAGNGRKIGMDCNLKKGLKPSIMSYSAASDWARRPVEKRPLPVQGILR